MKQLPVITFLMCSFLAGKSQTQLSDTSKVEQYCEVICTERMFSSKVMVEIDFGELSVYPGGQDLQDIEAYAKGLNRLPDALNYMGQKGWVLQSSYYLSSHTICHFIFKKTFLKTEVTAKAGVK
jgi:hypothetical protein